MFLDFLLLNQVKACMLSQEQIVLVVLDLTKTNKCQILRNNSQGLLAK